MKPMPEDWDRGVAVVAHPDDLEYGVAAAVARWTRQGKKVDYLLATKGEAGIAGLHPDQTRPLRMEEQLRSARAVGVNTVAFLDHPDGLVEYGVPLRRDLAAAFRSAQPEMVITTSFDLTWGSPPARNGAFFWVTPPAWRPWYRFSEVPSLRRPILPRTCGQTPRPRLCSGLALFLRVAATSPGPCTAAEASGETPVRSR